MKNAHAFNTHFFRGTRTFTIEASSDLNTWYVAATGTLPEATSPCSAPLMEFAADQFVYDSLFKYIRFTANTFYGAGPGLQFFDAVGCKLFIGL